MVSPQACRAQDGQGEPRYPDIACEFGIALTGESFGQAAAERWKQALRKQARVQRKTDGLPIGESTHTQSQPIQLDAGHQLGGAEKQRRDNRHQCPHAWRRGGRGLRGIPSLGMRRAASATAHHSHPGGEPGIDGIQAQSDQVDKSTLRMPRQDL